MSKEIEVFRLTPEKGKHYYAVVATRKIWDKTFNNTLGDWRYFAQESNKRYMGCFERPLRSGCGDGDDAKSTLDNNHITSTQAACHCNTAVCTWATPSRKNLMVGNPLTPNSCPASLQHSINTRCHTFSARDERIESTCSRRHRSWQERRGSRRQQAAQQQPVQQTHYKPKTTSIATTSPP